MNRYAIVDADGLVTNVVLWDGDAEFNPAGQLRLLPEDSAVSIGWQRVGRRWVAPPEPVVDEPDPAPVPEA